MFTLNEGQKKEQKKFMKSLVLLIRRLSWGVHSQYYQRWLKKLMNLLRQVPPIREIQAQEDRMKFSRISTDPQCRNAVIEGIKKSGVNAWSVTMGNHYSHVGKTLAKS